MYCDLYKIDGTLNLDTHQCFHDINVYPNFQTHLQNFKTHLKSLVNTKQSATFYKFGDGDYHFLKRESIGSASPGRRAISKS